MEERDGRVTSYEVISPLLQ